MCASDKDFVLATLHEVDRHSPFVGDGAQANGASQGVAISAGLDVADLDSIAKDRFVVGVIPESWG